LQRRHDPEGQVGMICNDDTMLYEQAGMSCQGDALLNGRVA